MHAEEQEDDYPETSANELVAPSDFQPFFTLVEDSNTGEHFHPYVHYVFSDDDPDLLTTAIIDSSQHGQESESAQRTILLDMSVDGRKVESIHSLSPDWQVSQATVAQAPSWNEADPQKTLHGLMLKIDGFEARKEGVNDHDIGEQHDDAVAQMESVIAGYGHKLAQLQSLMDAYSTNVAASVQDQGHD